MFALAPVVFMTAGSAVAQILQLSDVASVLALAGAAVMSAGVGLVVMRGSGPRLSAYGMQRPRNPDVAIWFLPALGAVLVSIVSQIGGLDLARWLPYAALAIATALNEELWFRGVIVTVLRTRGVRAAVYGSAALFAILHLANLAGGEPALDAALQLVFALLFGIAAARLVLATGSIWPAAAWHAAWNFVNLLAGDQTTPVALIGLGLASTIILIYSMVVARRTQRKHTDDEREQPAPA